MLINIFVFLCICSLSVYSDLIKTPSGVNITSTPAKDGWWQIKKTSDDWFYPLQQQPEIEVFIRSIPIDPRDLHSCYEYTQFNKLHHIYSEVKSFCYPYLIVTGYRK